MIVYAEPFEIQNFAGCSLTSTHSGMIIYARRMQTCLNTLQVKLS